MPVNAGVHLRIFGNVREPEGRNAVVSKRSHCVEAISLGDIPMIWTTPTLIEICIGLEINGYLPAEF